MTPEASQGLKAYQRVHVESMSPGELVLATYDVAIQACDSRDLKRAGQAVYELMSGLDFTYEEMAGQLLVLYDWIYRRIKEGELDEAKHFLSELRETWIGAIDAEAAARGSGDREAHSSTG